MNKTEDGYECRKHGKPTDMPYKQKVDKQANDRRLRGMQLREKWHHMGLEEIGDTLRCLTCGKETHKFTSDLFRHTNDCAMRIVTLSIMGKTEKDTQWSRRKKNGDSSS
jgi:hypothetical protein